MASIDGISPVDVCTDCVAFAFVLAKNICLVGTGVGSQNRVLVNVVGVRSASSGVVWREP